MIPAFKRNMRLNAAVIGTSAGLLYIIVNSSLLRAPVLDSVKFILFLAVFLLPGIALVRLFEIKQTPLISAVCSVTFSFGLQFLLYLCFSLTGLQDLFFIIPIIMAVSGAAGLRISAKKKLEFTADKGELAISLALSAAALFIVTLSLTAGNLTPDITGPREYHVDLLNSVGLVESAFRGFPFTDIKAYAIPYRYHALSFSFLAVMKSVTGFTDFDLITRYSLTVFTPYAVMSLMALTKKITSRNIFLPLTFAALFLLKPYENPFLYYMYRDTLGFSLALGLSAVSVIFFIDAARDKERVFSKHFLLSSAVLALATAAKGPLAAVILAGFGFSLLMMLIKREKPIPVLLRGGFMLCGFVLIYFLIYGINAAGQVVWYPGRFVRDTWANGFISGSDGIFKAVAAYQIVSGCFAALGIVLLLVYIVFNFKKDNPFAEFALGAALCGVLLTNLTHQYGASEIYFMLAGYPFAVMGISYVFSSVWEKDAKHKKTFLFVITALCIVCSAVSVLPSISFFEQNIYMAGKYSEGSAARVDDEYKLMAVDYKRGDMITEPEYQALLWIKENTRSDAIIASGSVLTNSKYMYGSAFSERVFFLEGYIYITSYDELSPDYDEIMRRVDILRSVFEQASDSALILLKQSGVEYILQSKWQYPALELDLPVVYENEQTVIWRLI